jgi:hypothetical protein
MHFPRSRVATHPLVPPLSCFHTLPHLRVVSCPLVPPLSWFSHTLSAILVYFMHLSTRVWSHTRSHLPSRMFHSLVPLLSCTFIHLPHSCAVIRPLVPLSRVFSCTHAATLVHSSCICPLACSRTSAYATALVRSPLCMSPCLLFPRFDISHTVHFPQYLAGLCIRATVVLFMSLSKYVYFFYFLFMHVPMLPVFHGWIFCSWRSCTSLYIQHVLAYAPQLCAP